MRKIVWFMALTVILFGTSFAYADLVPPQENTFVKESLLIGLPLLAIIAASYLWSSRKVIK